MWLVVVSNALSYLVVDIVLMIILPALWMRNWMLLASSLILIILILLLDAHRVFFFLYIYIIFQCILYLEIWILITGRLRCSLILMWLMGCHGSLFPPKERFFFSRSLAGMLCSYNLFACIKGQRQNSWFIFLGKGQAWRKCSCILYCWKSQFNTNYGRFHVQCYSHEGTAAQQHSLPQLMDASFTGSTDMSHLWMCIIIYISFSSLLVGVIQSAYYLIERSFPLRLL